MKMQKLRRRDTYTPMGATLARGNCGFVVKHDCEVGQVLRNSKTLCNNSDEYIHSGKSGQDLRVPVINLHSEPLMPTTPRKARVLLKQGRAKVVKRTPFVIQLTAPSGENKQDVTLGIDAGYSSIGFSAVTEKQELMCGEVALRKDVSKLIQNRAMYRRIRRSRLWHRPPRFDNRNKKEGELPPSLQHKLDTHIRLIDSLKSWLPITKTVIEVATFDAAKMANPEISGVEYQQGELQGYKIREYLLEKWKRKCVYCGKKNIRLEVEHIIPKSRTRDNRVSNLTIACRGCNQKKGNLTAEEFGFPKLQEQALESLKAAPFMNTIRGRLAEQVSALETFGYITKHGRIKAGLEKSHVNDAFIIAGGNGQVRAAHHFMSRQVRRQNRSLYKANLLSGGRRKRNTVKEVHGFRRFDKVRFENNIYFIHGLRTRGYFCIKDFTGNINFTDVSHKKLDLLEHPNNYMKEVKVAVPRNMKND